MGKPLKETGFFKFLTRKVPDLAMKVITGGPGALLGELGNTVRDVLDVDPELTAQERQAMLEEFNQVKIAEIEAATRRITSAHEVEKVQLAQEDRFTKRARPFRQYSWVALLFVCYALYPVLNSGEMITLPMELIIGMFADMGVYTISRSAFDKQGKPGIMGQIKNIMNR